MHGVAGVHRVWLCRKRLEAMPERPFYVVVVALRGRFWMSGGSPRIGKVLQAVADALPIPCMVFDEKGRKKLAAKARRLGPPI